MKLTTPFTILRDVLKNKAPASAHCFIDDTEVSMKECLVEIEENLGVEEIGQNLHQEGRLEVSTSQFWDKECAEHPINSHGKGFQDWIVFFADQERGQQWHSKSFVVFATTKFFFLLTVEIWRIET